MYCIAFYDVNEKRVQKIHKLFLQYLYPLQNSVFEGDLTGRTFRELDRKVSNLIVDDEDSVIFFCMDTDKFIRKYYRGNRDEPKFRNII
jgi:CRISPR-associated protein Cas2